MKRMLAILLVLAMPWICCAERAHYAWFGNVAVFEEGEKLGLVNRAGEVVLPAQYDSIHPFQQSACLQVLADGRCGLVNGEGAFVLPCEYAYFSDYDAERGWIIGVEKESNIDVLLNLNSGEAVLRAQDDAQMIFWNEHYVVVVDYSPLSMMRSLTMHKVYDAQLNYLFEFRGPVDLLKHSAYLRTGETIGKYGILNPDGSVLLDELFLCSELDDGKIVYMKKLTDAEVADEDTCPYRVGLIDESGVCFEREGYDIYDTADELGFYRVELVNADHSKRSYIYVDEDGHQAVPGSFDQAYPFVNGAAVVKQGERYFLIDASGERIGSLEWRWSAEDDSDWMWIYGFYSGRLLSQVVVPVETPEGYRLADRSGEFIDENIWKEINETYGEETVFLCRDFEGKLHFIGMDGREAVPGEWDNIQMSDVPGYAWAQQDGLWGMIDLYGAETDAGAYLSDERFTDIYYGTACLPDGESWVYFNHRGEAISPAEEPVEYF